MAQLQKLDSTVISFTDCAANEAWHLLLAHTEAFGLLRPNHCDVRVRASNLPVGTCFLTLSHKLQSSTWTPVGDRNRLQNCLRNLSGLLLADASLNTVLVCTSDCRSVLLAVFLHDRL